MKEKIGLAEIFEKQKDFKEKLDKKISNINFKDDTIKNRMRLIKEEWSNLSIEFG